MMKKISLSIVLFTIFVSFAALFRLGIPTVKAAGSQQGASSVAITLTSYFDSTNTVTHTVANSTYGNTLSFDGTIGSGAPAEHSYTFGFWVVNGVIRQDLPDHYSFTLTSDNEFQAVFVETGKLYVAFVDVNGQILKVQYGVSGFTATEPAVLPTKPGFAVNAALTRWSLPFVGVTQNTITVLQYTISNATTYALSVTNGTGDNTYAFNAVATVSADAAPSGQVFHHWEVDDQTVSYQSTFSFTMLKATTITAYYAASAATDLPRITVSNNTGIRTSDGKKSYVGQYYLPAGYTFVEAGLLTHVTNTAMIDINTSGVTRRPATRFTTTTKEFLMSIPNASIGCVKGYLIAKNPSNALVTVYSENSYNVLNGGFEYGANSLYGWNVYGLWKDESGMAAFSTDLVHNGTYFDNEPYGRDGNYQMGITGGSVSWNQSEERMGYLRSSDFTLGGSGWVSFKLGGGKSTAFAYVSVRKTSDNIEIARFGNPNWNVTTKATAQYGSSISNAEAFLFQYYFNLGSVGTSGETYYFLFCDTAGYWWSILSVDSLVTYYPVAPTPGANQTATNILPSIPAEGGTAYTVSNDLTANVTNWEDPSGIFQWNDRARTNKTCGNDCLGVVRSSRFTYNDTYDYLKWSWEGNISRDKQIFVSIKEYGTNIEVLRLVRRSNLSGKTGGGPDAHWYDVTSYLTVGRQYYIELSDNLMEDYGIISVDNVRLSSNHTVTGSDVAERISGLPTNFVYVKPSNLS